MYGQDECEDGRRARGTRDVHDQVTRTETDINRRKDDSDDREDSAPLLILILTLLVVGGAFFLYNQGYRLELTNEERPTAPIETMTLQQDSELLDAIQRVMEEMKKVSAIQMKEERELRSSMSLIMPQNPNGYGDQRVEFNVTTLATGSLHDIERSCQEHLGSKIRKEAL